MKFCSLGSGSKGNCALIEAGGKRVVVDCGFGLKNFVDRLAEKAPWIPPESIDAIFVTHEHGDHATGVPRISRKFGTQVYLTAGTAEALGKKLDGANFELISDEQAVHFGDLSVTPFTVPHDAREPVQFRISHDAFELGIISDCGHVTPHMVKWLSGCDALMLEANHCTEMLRDGPYPEGLQYRVGGAYGHLNNDQSLDLLGKLDNQRLKMLVATHLSEQNNCPIKVEAALAAALPSDKIQLTIASQGEGFDWHDLTYKEAA